MEDLVFDMIRETVIKMVLEDTFSIALDLCYDLVKLNHVLCYNFFSSMIMSLAYHSRPNYNKEHENRTLMAITYQHGAIAL